MGSGSSTSKSQPTLTGPETNLVNLGVNELTGGVENLPNWAQLYQDIPLQGVAGLTGTQDQLLNRITGGINNQGLNKEQQQAAGTLSSYLGPINSNPQVQAEQNYINQTVLPTTQNQSALEGSGTSGASLEAVANAQTGAMTPVLENAASNQLSAANELAGIGSTGNAQLQQALEAAGLPQQVAQEQANAIYNQQSQKQQFGTAVQQQPLSLVPASLGSTSVSSPSKF